MDRVLDRDIGVHFYDGPDDEEGYIFTIAKSGAVFPFKGESVESFVSKGQDMVEITLFEALKKDPDPDRVSQDYRQCVTFEFSLGKKVRKDTEVSFEISIDRNGKLLAKLKETEKKCSRTLQLKEASAVDEIEAVSVRIHEALENVGGDLTDGSDRLYKWLLMNDEILKGLKENRDREDGHIRRFSLPADEDADVSAKADHGMDENDAEQMLIRMDRLISRGLDHATGQRKRKLERAHERV